PPATGMTKPAAPDRRRAASLPSAMSCASTRSIRPARAVSQNNGARPPVIRGAVKNDSSHARTSLVPLSCADFTVRSPSGKPVSAGTGGDRSLPDGQVVSVTCGWRQGRQGSYLSRYTDERREPADPEDGQARPAISARPGKWRTGRRDRQMRLGG